MDIRKLQRVIIDALEDVKAQDIAVYNTTTLSDLFDRVILASGTSNRHTRSLASNVAEKVKHAGGSVISIEGGDTGEWVLVDLGDAVVHIMQPAIRSYYTLEELWGGHPVNLKLAGPAAGKRSARHASAPAPQPDGAETAHPAPPAKVAKVAKATKAAKAAKAAKPTQVPKGAKAAKSTHITKPAKATKKAAAKATAGTGRRTRSG